MNTSATIPSQYDGANHSIELAGNRQRLTSAGKECRRGQCIAILLCPREIELQVAIKSAEQRGALKARPLPVGFCPRSMARDQEIVGMPSAKHLNSHQHESHHQRMHAVHGNRVQRMEPSKRLSLLS